MQFSFKQRDFVLGRRGTGCSILLGLFLAFSLNPLFAADALFERAKARYESAKSSASSELRKRELLESAREFKQVVDRSEVSQFRPEALFYLGMIHQGFSGESRDPASAGRSLHYYRTLVRDHEKHRLADDSWLQIAKICSEVFSDQRCADEARQKVAGTYSKRKKSKARRGFAKKRVERASSLTLSRVSLDRVSGSESVSLHFRPEGKSDSGIAYIPRYEAKYLGENLDPSKSARFFVDLRGVKLDSFLRPPKFPADSKIKSIRFGQFTKDVARVVLDLRGQVKRGEVHVEEDGGLSIRFGSKTSAIQPEFVKPFVAETAPPRSSPEAEVLDLPKKKTAAIPLRQSGKKRVVLDAGHGGHDPGARGRRGTKEKDICLAVTKRVAKILERKGAYEIFMTRKDDRYLSLLDRTKFANKKNGDLFVSIHANASPKRSARGISTYFLDNADDEESLRVAMRENGELSIEQLGQQAKGDDYFLEVMKASMVKNFHTVQSTDLARHVQNMMMSDLSRRYSKVRDLGVRSAKFYVLTGATMPSVLVETSFISNSLEEKRLRSSTYQERIAQAVVKGIENFFKSSVGKGDHTALYQP